MGQQHVGLLENCHPSECNAKGMFDTDYRNHIMSVWKRCFAGFYIQGEQFSYSSDGHLKLWSYQHFYK